MLEEIDVDGEDDRRRELRTLEKEKSRRREETILTMCRFLWVEKEGKNYIF